MQRQRRPCCYRRTNSYLAGDDRLDLLFSTSCGYTTGLEVWQQEALPYLGVHSLVQNEGMGSSADIFLRDGQVTAYDSESRFSMAGCVAS